MKLFIPAEIQGRIPDLPSGTVLLGGYSEDWGAASVVGFMEPGDGGARRHADTLAELGGSGRSTPFRVTIGAGSASWFHHGGCRVEVVVYEPSEYFKRTPFNERVMGYLREERVLIVGMGSVGAFMGLEMAKSGVGELIAVDKDHLEVHNCMRHVLGTPYLGQPKAIAFRGFLEKQAPGCECFSIHEDLFRGDRERLREVIEQYHPTRILAATDSLHVQYMCQMTALYFDIPLMAVWCDNNAVEGEIFLWETGQAQRWMPGRAERGCYGCLRPPSAPSLTRSASFEYSSDDPDSYGGEPALGTFINRISNIASIFMIAWMLRTRSDETLLGGVLDLPYVDSGCQYIRLGGPYPFEAEGRVTASGPWSVDWYRVKKEEACPFCSDEDRNEANLFPSSVQ